MSVHVGVNLLQPVTMPLSTPSSFPYPYKARCHLYPVVPQHPTSLLIHRTAPNSLDTMTAPSFLQLQTQAGHGPKPVNLRKTKNNSDESISTLSSSNSSSRHGSLDIVRCSRCQRALSIDSTGPACQSGAIRFGLNSYYCTRCANHVGFVD